LDFFSSFSTELGIKLGHPLANDNEQSYHLLILRILIQTISQFVNPENLEILQILIQTILTSSHPRNPNSDKTPPSKNHSSTKITNQTPPKKIPAA
jgi:hypothetical protein